MLPSKGYFQDIECPYLDNSCNRPYCHFRHKKKGQDNNIDEIPVVDDDETVVNETTNNSNNSEIPTYKPTPKSELANIRNHIPISYVPDLEFRSTGRINRTKTISTFKPTYKPTPLSVLSSVSKQDEISNKNNKVNNNDGNLEIIEEIQQNIADVKYNPEISLQNDINFEELTSEFKLIDDIIEKPSPDNVETNENKETKEQKKNEDKSTKSKEKTSDRNHSRSRKHKSSDRDRDKDKKKTHEKSKHSDRSRHKSSHKHSSGKDRHRKRSREREKDHNKKKSKDDKYDKNYSDNDCDNNEIVDLGIEEDEEEDDDENDTLMECYKIFNEYQPEKPNMETTPKSEETKQPTKESIQIGKKRIAHTSSLLSSLTDIQPKSKLPVNKPKIQQNPALVMTNRFKLAKLSHSNSNDNDKKLDSNNLRIIEEKKQSIKRPLTNPTDPNPNKRLMKSFQKPTTTTTNLNLIDSIINESKSQPKFTRKIAPVLNVNSIQKAKAKIEELTKSKTINNSKTPAQILKNAKRTAHVPDVSLSNLPDVLNADKSKLPVNVRTRFLTMIADECVKLYLNKEDAYNRALNEEFTCYEKCKVLLTYKNSVMLTVNRLRKEFQEREKSGLGPIDNNECSNNQSTVTKDKQLYDYIKSYLLNDEELDLHGYPRESSTPGRAIIKNRKNQTETIKLKKNQRKCCRCSKIFQVDVDGFALYKEECLYHPLKKRTLRGEQTYLCCKSNDDTGCVTSNTHVSDMGDNMDLDGFQTTLEPDDDNDPRSYTVYALDCEMCYTIKGLELTRITIVDTDCKTVYESLVKPLNPIIDYNTQFSGITKEQMDKTSTNILQVQANILHLCNSKTILIGHSLESDMKALKIIHNTIIDTSVLFPHKMGLPHKRALKALASDYLKKIIQNNVDGHDSAEDAITCMELVKWKLNEELKVRGIKLV